MQKFMGFIMFFLIFLLIACAPAVSSFHQYEPLEPNADPISGLSSSSLPDDTNRGRLFLMINGVSDQNKITLPYQFTHKADLIASTLVMDVVTAMVNSGVYFSPDEYNHGKILAYNAKEGDHIWINYLTGEFWIEYQGGLKSQVEYALQRSSGIDFTNWRVDDEEIEVLNQSLSNKDRNTLITGDAIEVSFVLISSNHSGVYLQYLSNKQYILK